MSKSQFRYAIRGGLEGRERLRILSLVMGPSTLADGRRELSCSGDLA